jgi:hypothetical protein
LTDWTNRLIIFKNLKKQVGALGEYGDEIVMLAISIAINRPILYINAGFDEPINNNYDINGSNIVMTHFERNGLYKFCIAYANEKLLAIEPLLLAIVHYTAIVPKNDQFISDVVKSFQFKNFHEILFYFMINLFLISIIFSLSFLF